MDTEQVVDKEIKRIDNGDYTDRNLVDSKMGDFSKNTRKVAMKKESKEKVGKKYSEYRFWTRKKLNEIDRKINLSYQALATSSDPNTRSDAINSIAQLERVKNIICDYHDMFSTPHRFLSSRPIKIARKIFSSITNKIKEMREEINIRTDFNASNIGNMVNTGFSNTTAAATSGIYSMKKEDIYQDDISRGLSQAQQSIHSDSVNLISKDDNSMNLGQPIIPEKPAESFSLSTNSNNLKLGSSQEYSKLFLDTNEVDLKQSESSDSIKRDNVHVVADSKHIPEQPSQSFNEGEMLMGSEDISIEELDKMKQIYQEEVEKQEKLKKNAEEQKKMESEAQKAAETARAEERAERERAEAAKREAAEAERRKQEAINTLNEKQAELTEKIKAMKKENQRLSDELEKSSAKTSQYYEQEKEARNNVEQTKADVERTLITAQKSEEIANTTNSKIQELNAMIHGSDNSYTTSVTYPQNEMDRMASEWKRDTADLPDIKLDNILTETSASSNNVPKSGRSK